MWHGRLAFVPLAFFLIACRDAGTSPEVAPSASASASPASRVARSEEPLPAPADSAPPPPAAPPPPTALPLSEAEFAAFLTSKAKVTESTFETALLRIATCDAKPGTKWVPTCPAYDDLLKVVTDHYRGGDGFPGAPALRHLRHPSFGVRATAVSFASAHVFEGARNVESEQLYLDAMRSETEVEVLENLVRRSGPGAARNAGIRGFVLRSLAHADERVRVSALEVIARPEVFREVPDAFLRLAAATRTDRPPLERAAGCAHVGKIDDPRAVELLAGLLADAELPADIRGACFEGLVSTWTRSPEPERPSRRGYELTMIELTKRPRSVAAPHERGVRALASVQPPRPARKGFLRSAEPAPEPPLLDVTALSDALASIVLDDDAGPRARSAAGVALVRLEQRETITTTIQRLKEEGNALTLVLAGEIEKEAAGRADPFSVRF